MKRKIIAGLLTVLFLTGCGRENGVMQNGQGIKAGNAESTEIAETTKATEGMPEDAASENGAQQGEAQKGALGESAADGEIDFSMLQEKNPDIFAWLYVPGTGIDTPVLQSPISDDYYISHGMEGEENSAGAPYTEMPNMMNMCDFNTIIHGSDRQEGEPFYELHKFENPDFFEENREFYIYLPDNVLTYEVLTAYYDEGSDILRRHDYTTYQGCQDYLEELKGSRSMGKNIQEGWEDLSPYHFLVTLDGRVGDNNTQYVVIGILTGDAAGKIDRIIYE